MVLRIESPESVATASVGIGYWLMGHYLSPSMLAYLAPLMCWLGERGLPRAVGMRASRRVAHHLGGYLRGIGVQAVVQTGRSEPPKL